MAIKVAGDQYYDIDGQLTEIKRQLRQKSGYPFDASLLKDSLQKVVEGKFGDMKPPSLFSLIATTNLDAVPGKLTQECFVDWKYRDLYMKNQPQSFRLPLSQATTGACVITTLAIGKDVTLDELTSRLLGICICRGNKYVSKIIRRYRYTVTLPQIEKMVLDGTLRQSIGIRDDTYGNFFFIENGHGNISFCRVYFYEDWGVHFDSGLHSYEHWKAGFRLFVPNLDASRLGL